MKRVQLALLAVALLVPQMASAGGGVTSCEGCGESETYYGHSFTPAPQPSRWSMFWDALVPQLLGW